MHIYVHTNPKECMHLHVLKCAYIHSTCIHYHKHTLSHTDMYIHTYIHTCIHTHMHTYMHCLFKPTLAHYSDSHISNHISHIAQTDPFYGQISQNSRMVKNIHTSYKHSLTHINHVILLKLTHFIVKQDRIWIVIATFTLNTQLLPHTIL